MGADLIGYFLLVPKDKKTTNTIMKQQSDRIKKALIAAKKEAKHGGDSDDVIQILAKAGVDRYELEDKLEYSYNGLLPELLADLEAQYKELSKLKPHDFYARDLACEETKRGLIYFAGEMSWGDSPDGLGYQTLKQLTFFGYADKLKQKLRY